MTRKGSSIFQEESVSETPESMADDTKATEPIEASQDTKQLKVKASIKSNGKAKKTIIIEKQDNYEGQYDVTVGVNGYVYQIKRGVPVEVPPEVIEVLKNAVISKMVKDDHGNDVLVDMPRFLWREVRDG